MDELYIIMIEVIEVDYLIFEESNITILSNKVSVNDYRDLTIKGTKKELLSFLEIYHGEGIEYFNKNQVRL